MKVIGGFEAGMKCLQNPSLISQFFYSFWKCGALILAVSATFVCIIRRGKIISIPLHAVEPSSQAFVQKDEAEFSDDDDCSSVSSEEDEEDQQDVDEDFRVKGSRFYLKLKWQNSISRHMKRLRSGGERFGWSKLTSSRSVVKLWDNLVLGSDCSEKNNDNDSIPSVATPKMVFTAKRNENGAGVVLGGYDIRLRRRVPAISAEWCLPAEAVAGTMNVSTGGVEKVYVSDDIKGILTVGDVRNVTAPVENVTERDGEMWWDANTVIVEDEFRFVDGSR